MKKFELYEQYLEQNEGMTAARQRYDQKVAEAEQALNAAKVKLDEVVHAEIASGSDKGKEKAGARKVIEQAEKDVAYAKEERTTANSYFSGPGGSITRPQIVQAYLKEYVPAVKAEHLPEIQARMKQGADLMLSAFYDFTQLKREYHDIHTDIKAVNDAAVAIREQEASFYIANPFDNRADSRLDLQKLASQLNSIARGEPMPANATYIEKSFEIKENK
ncbi:hypothetical protein [Peribacillus asahii]|uniref:hypothetical protein n=1 Tax=Peribacillus asahii TaxID=228899 RepID=UPI00207AB8F8|nr:hypothetical protein [Peribacillus asahii]USK70192.1 hypothetical protein LIS76_22355 [Peribacillus asahii]